MTYFSHKKKKNPKQKKPKKTKKPNLSSTFIVIHWNKVIPLLTFVPGSLSHLHLPIDFATTPHITESFTVIVWSF